MKTYTLTAPAKINLFLEILGDRPDGFHELFMVLQSIGLKDQIQIRANGTEEIRLFCPQSPLPTDGQNLAYRAAQLMQSNFPQAFARYGGVDLELEKRIPVAAGLAGGSADAAAVLVGLDLLWELGLTLPELQTLAAQLGSDIPFCLAGGTALATGRGEKLDPLPAVDQLWVVLAKYQTLEVSTPWAYQTYRQQFGHQYLALGPATQQRTQEIHAGPLIQAILHQNTVQIAQSLHNDLEKVVFPHYPQVAQLKEIMAQSGGLATLMSGSGPTVFSLCGSQAEAQSLQSQVQQQLPQTDLGLWIAPLCSHGIQVR